ncbi:hypothetical protein ASPWEDRAFT_30859 [Aspergillus wentii DTO 134E9]|uniref:Ubiquitin 3 binding protein But2 C-terminal domain-containing protein n=1 Tax=Aspergillus wentii DTO 134E9 TaxID=1073089 RepID=A0A1L9RAG0_ASPWE|nr:uncharacterized protein ASPWEDRAFT_30859 [Aspergillus wentii DTO 134E9]KAI9934479.1 hypothetical protein MW887_000093 [Aspergillus wentii]OJJ31889.1 hypothetical protein ASPWEDRAFT_30859 [Aspergillus wentii DTO 134E9]
MKTPSILLATISSLLPLTEALVGLQWSVANVSSSGLQNITFPISIANAPHKAGFYFAQQFAFNGVSDVGYTGLQPRPDKDGSSIIHAVFSSFIPGSTSTDNNCHNGADGGAGVSCAVEIPATYAHKYNLVVENTAETTWTGTLVDTVTGVATHIGAYALPSGTGGIKGSQGGFVEYYPWNSQSSHKCGSLPRTVATFGEPSTGTPGAGSPSLFKPYEYGDCTGQVKFGVRTTDDGYEVTVGF